MPFTMHRQNICVSQLTAMKASLPLVKHECIDILFMQIRDIYILPILVSRLLFLWATPAHQPLLYILTRNSH